MATTTTEVAHLGSVTCELEPERYQASCRCGWQTAWSDDLEAIELAAAEHPDSAADPGDGLDRVMGELLDLQDDLADMVVWLAENWSADLPVPVVYGRYGGGDTRGPVRVDLSAYCGDPADLGRIAHLLGVPMVEDEHPDCYGSRYRQARRDFGRVGLRAYTSIEPDRGRVS